MTNFIGSVPPKDVQTVLTRVFDVLNYALRTFGISEAAADFLGSTSPRDVQTVLTRSFDTVNNALKIVIVGGSIVVESIDLWDLDKSNKLIITWNENDASDRRLNIEVRQGNRTLVLYENLTIGDGFDLTLTAEDNPSTITLDNVTFEVENLNALQHLLKLVVGTDVNATLTVEGVNSVVNQDVTTDANVVFAGATLNNTGLKLNDTDASHTLTIAPGSNLTTNRTLAIVTGDASRTVTLQGNPTLSDWFDQSVKTTADVVFNRARATTTIAGGVVALVYANPLAVDMTLGNVFTVTTTAIVGNTTINATGGTAGQSVIFIITGDVTGGRVITWGTGFYAGLDTLIVGASTIAVQNFIYDGVSWKPQAPPYPSIPVYIWK